MIAEDVGNRDGDVENRNLKQNRVVIVVGEVDGRLPAFGRLFEKRLLHAFVRDVRTKERNAVEQLPPVVGRVDVFDAADVGLGHLGREASGETQCRRERDGKTKKTHVHIIE